MIILHLILHSSVHIYDFHIFITSEIIYIKFNPCIILECGKFLHVESRIQHIFAAKSGFLGLGIRSTAQGTRNPSTDWNPIQVPLTKNPVSSSSNPQSKTVLSNSLTWDEKSNIRRRGVSLSLACKQTLLYFSFRSFQKHRRARENERGARERKLKYVYFYFLLPPPLLPCAGGQ